MMEALKNSNTIGSKSARWPLWPLWWGLAWPVLAACTSFFLIPPLWWEAALPFRAEGLLTIPTGLAVCWIVPPPPSKGQHFLSLLFKSVGPAILCVATLLFLLPLPSEQEALALPHVDKLVHFLIHAFLAAYFTALYRSPLALPFFLAYGTGIEAAQLLIEYRDWETGDLLANLAGVCAGHFLLARHFRRGIHRVERWVQALAS